MDHKDLSAPDLPGTRNDPEYIAAKGCARGDLLEISTDQPLYPLPTHQQMPTQA